MKESHIKRVGLKKTVPKAVVSEKKAMVKIEYMKPAKSGSLVKCLTCPLKSTKARTISVMLTSNKQTLKTIILLVTGVQANENDFICVDCCNKAIQAFEFRQMARKQVNEKISERDESFQTPVKYEYEVDLELEPKRERERTSPDDYDDVYDDFTFSDLDDEDTTLQSSKKTTTKSKTNGESKNVIIPNESTISESLDTDTKLKSSVATTVQSAKMNKSNTALTVKCNQCSKTFSECLELLHHVRMVHRKNVFVSDKNRPKKLTISKTCAIIPSPCNSKLKAAGVKEQHVKRGRPSKTVEWISRCGVCYLLFSDDAALETHLTEHIDTEAIMCGECSRVYHKFPHFKRHFNTYHPEETDIIQAEATETLLEIEDEEVRQQLVQYIRMTTIGDLVSANVPLEEEKETRMFAHACGICGELSISPEQVEEHKNEIHAAELATRCFICGITFGSGDTVGLYHSLNCRKRQLPSECVICGVKVRSSLVLEGHVQMQHPQEFARWEKKYCERKCDKCGGEFSSRDSLRYHLRMVCPDDDGEFSCDQCDKKFKVKLYLINHMARVHNRPQETHVCPVCGKLVKNINVHMTLHSGRKPYKCKFCPAAFRLSHERTYHERKHTKDSPYKCTECNKSFNRPSSHKLHMMKHTGEKPNKCDLCDAAFIQKICLIAHMRKHEPYEKSLPLDPHPFDEPPATGAEIEVITEENSDSELDWSGKKEETSSW